MKHFVNSGQSHKHAFLQSNFVLLSLSARDKLAPTGLCALYMPHVYRGMLPWQPSELCYCWP